MAEGEEVFNSCGSVTEDRAAPDELPDIIPVNGYGEAEGDPNELPKTVIDYYISIEQVSKGSEGSRGGLGQCPMGVQGYRPLLMGMVRLSRTLMTFLRLP